MTCPSSRRVWLAATRCCARLAALTIAVTGAGVVNAATATASSETTPLVRTDNGVVRGAAVSGDYQFLGLPYAAPPTGNLRWRRPHPPAPWRGVRDATQFAPSCPQPVSLSAPLGPQSEDCLYLNVYTPTLSPDARRPVLFWIHGGGLTTDGARNYDGSKLAADGAVVVTINYRLGALGFLAHPALAHRPGGPTGNYGLMDQIAALRWVRDNIAQFGGDPHNVTIAGQSAGGLSVLALLVSQRSRGLFQRAIVQSGAFALKQVPLADAEVAGEAFAAHAGCTDQTAECLRRLSVSTLLSSFPHDAIPGVIDGRILTQSIGTALADGQFAHVPVLNGVNQIEELIFVAGKGVAVSGGSFVQIPDEPIGPDNYQSDIAAVLGVSAGRAEAIAAKYPLAAYPKANVAFSYVVSDANFACPALQVDRWTAAYAPTFGYEFDDSNAPGRFAPFRAATHSSEIQYIFDQPNTPLPGGFTADQQTLASSMRAAWTSFAANGDPSTDALDWPAFNQGEQVMSLVPPQPQLEAGFSDTHHCSFWADATATGRQ